MDVGSTNTSTGFCTKCGTALAPEVEFCSKCGQAVAGGAPEKPPVPSQPLPKTAKKPIYKRWWFWAVVIITILFAASRSGSSSTSTSEDSASATPKPASAATKSIPTATPGPQLPDDQKQFIDIVVGSQAKARAAENDMQRGGIKADRDKELCAAVPKMQVQNWVGTLAEISANSDGFGVLSIELTKDLFVKTWNNALSDMLDKTLITPGTPLFNTASQLKKGNRVKFSGVFFRASGVDCLREASLTLSGKLRSPEFIFRFDSVSAD
ncbi:MAG: zinc ribbon domain-containing protein [Chloroflexi bacterium]|nr:zinc ribbon domain-containing protein [Chloroflexota bacterium]